MLLGRGGFSEVFLKLTYSRARCYPPGNLVSSPTSAKMAAIFAEVGRERDYPPGSLE